MQVSQTLNAHSHAQGEFFLHLKALNGMQNQSVPNWLFKMRRR